MYIAHKRDDGSVQPLKAHLEGTAELAAAFAAPFGAADNALRTGLLHDIGKYSPAGQRRMLDHDRAPRVDHSTAGAQAALALHDAPAAFAIAGHHGGLPDMGGKFDAADAGTLLGRKKRSLNGPLDPSAWTSEIQLDPKGGSPAWALSSGAYTAQFYTRMLFSCLVDADFLDTESFMRPGKPERGVGEPLPVLLDKLRAHVAGWLQAEPTSDLNYRRTQILRACLQGDRQPRGLYTLTVPTGGGKTISSMAFALSHAVKHGLSRVIYVIPYTSIIEQNAAVFRGILGEDNVLEHHSGVDFDDDMQDAENDRMQKLRLAAENWDAPVIVTTAVQFFESLYAARTSQCRKLHNLADSVIIFDEAQMLPVGDLRPCVRAITELVGRYGVTAVLCTATQPSLGRLIREFAPQMQIRELCPDADALVGLFRRVTFQREHQVYTEDVLAEALGEAEQVLCVVNKRKRAQDVCRLLPEEGRFHLSTLMTSEDRTRALRAIRERLKDGRPCRVVSTSLIEAGVDVDFPEVWREEAGLDSILQAAGRCNREARRPAEQCMVHVFAFEGRPLMGIAQNVAALRTSVDNHSHMDDPAAIRAYFDFLMNLKGSAMDVHEVLSKCDRMELHVIDDSFHIIDQNTMPIYIPNGENNALLEDLRRGCYSRKLFRTLSRSSVSVYPDHFKRLYEKGSIERLGEYRGGILCDPTAYSSQWGLSQEPAGGQAFML